ncbi:hypothetical protein B0H17DRAFT_44304 [Mycena rosella]|uniref:Uncharacterized protein n=1 Tax=Mycena rosella TaxID=1033263 RepID=A0AAD7D8V0_MYCRO|nr:hypothetical protein B0H17DRAFT_44304 [Mycena rosella]
MVRSSSRSSPRMRSGGRKPAGMPGATPPEAISVYSAPRDFSLLSSPADINDQGTWRKLCGLPWPSAIPASSKGVLSSGAHSPPYRGQARCRPQAWSQGQAGYPQTRPRQAPSRPPEPQVTSLRRAARCRGLSAPAYAPPAPVPVPMPVPSLPLQNVTNT